MMTLVYLVYFLIEEKLYYRTLQFSAKYQHDTAIGTHKSLSPWISFPNDVVTYSHGLSSLKQHKCVTLQFWRPEVRFGAP